VPKKRRSVTKIAASRSEARDAGPRPIPHYGAGLTGTPQMEYHLELADIALGLKKPQAKRTRLRNLKSSF